MITSQEKIILLIGAGNIGFRHFQAMLALDVSLKIIVVDPDQAALDRCHVESTVDNCQYKNDNSSIHCFNDLSGALKSMQSVDLAVIATNSDVRLSMLSSLCRHVSVKCVILEKVLFSNAHAYRQASKLIEQHKIHAWVNCPRRAMEMYQFIKKSFSVNHAKSMLRMNVMGGSWGLLCNAVHFFDLYFFLAGQLPVSRSYPSKNRLIKAKRLGFDELVGSIRLYDQNGSELVLHDTGGHSSRVIQIESGHQRYFIQEEDAVMLKVDTKRNQCETIAIDVEKTSVQMTRIFKSIMCQNYCELPTFLEAMQSHDLLMHTMKDLANQYDKELLVT